MSCEMKRRDAICAENQTAHKIWHMAIFQCSEEGGINLEFLYAHIQKR